MNNCNCSRIQAFGTSIQYELLNVESNSNCSDGLCDVLSYYELLTKINQRCLSDITISCYDGRTFAETPLFSRSSTAPLAQ